MNLVDSQKLMINEVEKWIQLIVLKTMNIMIMKQKSDNNRKSFYGIKSIKTIDYKPNKWK